MNQYTELLSYEAETLSPDDDDYEQRLREIAKLFRGFDEALTSFMVDRGYTGDRADIAAKTKFLTEQFKAAGIKPPRSIDNWFVPVKNLGRKTVFQLCFAFGLNVKQTNDFFRRVRFERSFDCHTISETVYYFCMRNKLSYSEAQEIIRSIEQISKPKTVKSIPDSDVLYTDTIIEYINSIDDKEKLIRYIVDNIDDFRYNNATAIKYIQELWSAISKADGLAEKEGSVVDSANLYEDKRQKGSTDTRDKSAIKAEVRYQEKVIKPDDYVVSCRGASTWTIFSQIIGLKNYQKEKFDSKRSLTSVLSENQLMPLRAAYCFPSRQNIEKLMRGDSVSDYEIIRKILIMLEFYNYWAKLIIKYGVSFSAPLSDSVRCLEFINNRLLDAGYPELYEGNPYDWVFMWASHDYDPLNAFRYYMGEVLAVKEEQNDVAD